MISIPSFLFLFCFIILQSLPHVFAANSSDAPLCHYDEMSALLQFKDSFVIDKRASGDFLAYPKIESWKLNDCCSWDGVTCDEQTGHVIGLDLSSSFLYGSINSSSSLFHLIHLQSLNLADNHFNYSQIPFELGHLSELTYLNLSFNTFVGQIPSTISHLTKLYVLDLSYNERLVFKNTDFRSLVHKLTNLEDLRLVWVDISSAVPNILENFTSLKYLGLGYCKLYGKFPVGIFLLPNLQTLDVSGNSDLKGHLPEFNFTSPLQELLLSATSLSGEIPASIGNLSSLNVLNMIYCGFSGKVPASLGNAKELFYLDLRDNYFEINGSSSLSWVSELKRLDFLGLSEVIFENEIPAYFANLTQLSELALQDCRVNGGIPPWLMNMTQLVSLKLKRSQLQGPIPDSIFQLRNLESLSLFGNNLNGTVELAMFLDNMDHLTELHLTSNNLSLIDNVYSNSTTRKFLTLGFGSCKLKRFPDILRNQDKLLWLDLSDNYIHGQIPKWLWASSRDAMSYLDLSSNFLTGFEQDPEVIPWTQVTFLKLTDNLLQGTLLLPPPSVEVYKVAANNLAGEVPSTICDLHTLRFLDLSWNNFTGVIPQCLGISSTNMQFLELRGNNFHGQIPPFQMKDCNLQMLSLDLNNLEGKVPRSLGNCRNLEYLLLGNNQINDVFPSWLGALQGLQVLILRSNKFHGVLGNHIINSGFPNLHIIDISQNNFSGQLPVQYFLQWNAMKMVREDQLEYMRGFTITGSSLTLTYNLFYSMSIRNKGIKLNYPVIIESFMAIDFSGNRFEGGIPEEIGNLSALRLLNLSNNDLNGSIPGSLGNLKVLECLDLSRNHLSGEIPQQLTQLGFLAVFNVSYNHLAGTIPHGKQFDTFQNDSYLNNFGLCGNPLSRKCANPNALPPGSSNPEKDKNLGSIFDFGWKPVAMGYGSGLIVGAIVGHVIVTRKLGWFLKTFRIRIARRAKGRKRRS